MSAPGATGMVTTGTKKSSASAAGHHGCGAAAFPRSRCPSTPPAAAPQTSESGPTPEKRAASAAPATAEKNAVSGARAQAGRLIRKAQGPYTPAPCPPPVTTMSSA